MQKCGSYFQVVLYDLGFGYSIFGKQNFVAWAAVAAIMRYSSLAALMAAGLSPLWAVLTGRGDVLALCLLLGILIYLRHWANITRLRAGTEPRIGKKP